MAPCEDLLRQVESGHSRRIAHDFRWVGEIVLVVAPELREGEYRREGTPAPPGATSTLLIVRHSRGNIAHPHAEEAADVDAHLHGGGHGENVDTVVIGMLVVVEKVLEPAFLVSGFRPGSGPCVPPLSMDRDHRRATQGAHAKPSADRSCGQRRKRKGWLAGHTGDKR